MPYFRIALLHPNGHVEHCTRQASHAQELHQAAQNRGLVVLHCQAQSHFGSLANLANLTLKNFQNLRKQSHGQAFATLPFVQGLGVMLQAGLSVPEALRALEKDKTQDPAQQRLLHSLQNSLAQGQSLAQALCQHPKQFDTMLCVLVHAAEQSGNLQHALCQYLAYAQSTQALKDKLRQAALYPCMVLGTGLAVLLFLLLYVVPRFAGIYSGLNSDLSWAVQAMVLWGQWANAHLEFVLGGIGLVFILLWRFLSKQGLLGLFTLLLGRHPHMVRVLRLYRLSVLHRALGLLLKGGIPAQTALQNTMGLATGADQQALRHASARLQQGQALSAALHGEGLSTEVSHHLVAAGERSGELAAMLGHAADFMDDEILRTLDWVSRTLEPLLMIAVGLLIGSVVVVLYLPIFDIASTLQ